MRKIMEPADRKASILQGAIRVASRPNGLQLLTSVTLAQQCKCARTLIYRYYPDMETLRRAVIKEAKRQELYPILEQVFHTLEPELRRRTAARMV